MTTARGDCHVCGAEEVEIHLLATCDRCRAAAGRFSHQAPAQGRHGRRAPQSTSFHESFCCSFCGRTPQEARKIFSGPWTFICDGCVALAAEAMREDLGEGWAPQASPPADPPSRQPSVDGRKTHPGHATIDRVEVTNVGRAPGGPTPRKTPRR